MIIQSEKLARAKEQLDNLEFEGMIPSAIVAKLKTAGFNDATIKAFAHYYIEKGLNELGF